MSNTTNNIRKLVQVVSVTDFGAKGDGTTDDTASIQAAINSANEIRIPPGVFNITSTLTLASYKKIIGSGVNSTFINISANVTGIRVEGSFVAVQGFSLQKTGTHTSVGIQNGTLALKCDRTTLKDLYVSGMGSHGVYLVNGNIGSIYNVHGNSNTGWGLYFNRDATVVDNHGWYIDGSCNWNGNTAGGVCLSAGTSHSDGTAPKSHSGRLNTQNNAGRGVYIGTSKNTFQIYSENNTSDNCYVDQYALGNNLHLIEGTIVGNIGGVAGSLDSCGITYSNHNANYRFGYKSKLEISGGTGKGLRIAGMTVLPVIMKSKTGYTRSKICRFVRATVTGAAATTIDWTARFSCQRVG